MSDVSLVTKYFPTINEGYIATTTAQVSSGAAIVPLSTIAGLTNGAVFVGIIEPGDATKQQVFTGTVDTAGLRITGVVWTRGTNVTHASGVTVVDYTTGTDINMIVAGILKQHNQDGTHKAITAAGITNSTSYTQTGGTFTVPTNSIDQLAMKKPIMGRFYRSADNVHQTNSWYLNNMDSTDTNLGGFVVTGGGIKVPYTGIYQVTGQNGFLDIPTSTGMGEILIGWNVNATGSPSTYARAAYITAAKCIQQTRTFQLTANDILYMFEYANGTTLNNYRLVGPNSDSGSFLEIEYKGPLS